MNKFAGFKAVAAIATIVAATAISTTALANPFNPFEALFGPHREPVAAPAYANPADDSALRNEFRRQVVDYRTSEAPGTIIVDTPNTYLYLVMPRRQGDALRHRRRPRRFHLVGHEDGRAQGRVAGLDAAARR